MEKNREKTIVKTSIIGIIVNIFLSIMKAVVGYLTNSIAIMMDSLNYLSDCVSSIVTIVGTKIANKTPDKEHPFGHGRVEYLASLVISIIIMYAGITALIESIQFILRKELPSYSSISLILVGISVIVKIILGMYYKRIGKKVKSETLVNSGIDALLDSLISLATLISALIFIFTGVSLESYLAVIISLIIIRSGFMMIKETISLILGRRVDRETAIKIKRIVNSFDEVNGCYDLVVNNYGPERLIASFHIEIDEKLNAVDIDILTRKITDKVYRKLGIIVSAIGIYSMNNNDPEIKEIKRTIEDIIDDTKGILSMHGFYLNKEEKTINLDAVVSFDSIKDKNLIPTLEEKINEKYPDYDLYIVIDNDVSD